MAIKQTSELDEVLRAAADRGASDCFLLPGEPVSFRVQGCIERSEGDTLTAAQVRGTASAAVGDEELARLGPEVGELRTSCGLDGVIDAQMTIARASGEYTIVLRILPSTVLTAEQACIPQAMRDAVESPNGIVVVAGPTGSGKTTAALALIEHLNASHAVHIITVEDPVCARLVPKQAIIQQREVGSDAPDVVAGMRAALRQDLDVLYIPELRNLAEIAAAMTVAETGHLVVVSAHGWSPGEVIERFIDVHPESARPTFRRRFARLLRAVSVQCLLRRASGKGRCAAYGVLVPDEDARRAIAAGEPVPEPEGTIRLEDAVQQKVDEGRVSADEAAAMQDAIQTGRTTADPVQRRPREGAR